MFFPSTYKAATLAWGGSRFFNFIDFLEFSLFYLDGQSNLIEFVDLCCQPVGQFVQHSPNFLFELVGLLDHTICRNTGDCFQNTPDSVTLQIVGAFHGISIFLLFTIS